MIYLLFLIPVVFLVLCVWLGLTGQLSGSWVKEDGTIVEWDGDGGGRILHPDGRLEEFPRLAK